MKKKKNESVLKKSEVKKSAVKKILKLMRKRKIYRLLIVSRRGDSNTKVSRLMAALMTWPWSHHLQ